MKLEISKNSRKIAINLFFSVTIMRLVIEYIYNSQISTLFSYAGFSNDFDFFRCVVSWLFMYSLIPFIVNCINNPTFSNMVLFVIYLINFVPGLILMTYTDLNFIIPWYIYYFLLYALAFFIKFSIKQNKHAYLDKNSIFLIGVFFSFIVLFIWIFYAQGRIIFNLIDVYDSRLEAREFKMPLLLSYILASMKIAIPVLIVWLLKNKMKVYALMFCLIQVLLFFIDGSKTTFFALITAILGYLVLNNNIHRIKYIPFFITVLGLISIVEYKVSETYYISAFIIRRLMFVPQSLNIRYYDFFTTYTPDYFQGSLLKIVGFNSQYGSIARTIGWYYSGNSDLAANNGLFSDAYANLGSLGVFIMPLMLILLFKILDSFARGLTLDSYFGAVIALSTPILSASYFTLFLTHGVVALLLFFYYLPRDQ